MTRNAPALFPPYLDIGSNGAAVRWLQQLLNALLHDAHIEITGEHHGNSVAMVKRLQSELLGFEGDDVDGKFGPGTRRALLEKVGINVDCIPAGSRDTTTWYGPNHVGPQIWPPLAA